MSKTTLETYMQMCPKCGRLVPVHGEFFAWHKTNPKSIFHKDRMKSCEGSGKKPPAPLPNNPS